MTAFHVFRPSEGAILDHNSLQSIADVPNRLLTSYLDTLQPGTPNIVLHGLEMVGEWASGGPPGTKRPEGDTTGVRITPGKAIVSDAEGNKYLLHIEEEMRLAWPTRNRAAVQAALVLIPQIEDIGLKGGVAVARQRVSPKLGFVDLQLRDKEQYLPIASAVGNGQDWATDFRRIYHPSHPVIKLLIKRFERLEKTVWQAEPEGANWGREVLGKNWFRYQTVAASALQAARALLMTYPTTTMDRVNLLTTLREQLNGSVQRASTELLQLIGSRDGAGPYSVVIPQESGE